MERALKRDRKQKVDGSMAKAPLGRPARFLIQVTAVLGLSVPALAEKPVDVRKINTVCLETILRNCKVLTAGFINRDDGGDTGAPMLAWQTQTGFTPEDGVLGGFVLLQNEAGRWKRLDSAFDGWRFLPPRLNEDSLLHIAGYTGGTGAYNADRLYRWDDTAWRAIDMKSWRATIARHLPNGLQIWKGVQYDFRDPWSGLVARTALWRGDDANCCPTGGDGEITFAIRDDRLVVTELRYTAPKPATTGPVPNGSASGR